MRESNNQNFKYCLYGAVAIVAIAGLYVAWSYVSSDKDFGFDIEWKFWNSSFLWPILSIIGFFLQFLDWQHTSFREGWVIKDSWGREKFVQNDDMMSTIWGGCLFPLLAHLFVIPCTYGAILYYIIIIPLALLNALIPYLAALLCIVLAVFFYKIAKNFVFKSSPLIKLFATMFLFLLLIWCVSLPTSHDFSSDEEQTSVPSQPKTIGYATVTTKVANLRRRRGINYEISLDANGEKLQMMQGSKIEIVEETNGWYKILTVGNETAYIKKTLCSEMTSYQSAQQNQETVVESPSQPETYSEDLCADTVAEEQTGSTVEQVSYPQPVKLYGSIDKYPVTMQLYIDSSEVKGTYYYNKQGPDKVLRLSGVINGTEISIYESDENGNQTGHFKGYYSDGEFYGQFATPNGNTMPFRLNK